jgi:hypothetical protein
MLATVLAAMALEAQAAPPADDGPLQTAPRERPASEIPLPGLDEKRLDIPPPAKPMDGAKAAPAKTVTIEPRTMVEGDTLQVVLGQRAVFHLDDKGRPVLDRVETGKLAEAHPPGEVVETFEPPADGQLAIALDGSAEKRATVLKIWNITPKGLDYGAIALIPQQGQIVPVPAPVCGVSAGSLRTEIWPRPVLAIGLVRFRPVDAIKPCPQN